MTERESPKRRLSQKTADFRRRNSSIWRAQETAENRRFSQKTAEKPQETADWAPSPEVRHLWLGPIVDPRGQEAREPILGPFCFDFMIGIAIAWYKARIAGFPQKSIREGASSLIGQGQESPKNVSCSRATPDLHWCNLGVALEQETFLGLSGPPPERLLAAEP